ncbi:DUF1275 family protein, partial [Streptomyces sp. NPDC004629]|uniref:DUF1275 family protein n=1 Tax=Streptomyces sp. NPDC004629 TaxID=3364705 RepID=UPI00369F74C9
AAHRVGPRGLATDDHAPHAGRHGGLTPVKGRGWARTAMLGTVAAAMGCQNAGVRVTMDAQAPTAYPTGLLTGAVTDAVTVRRVPWRVLVTMTLLILGAAAATLPERLRPGAAPLLPALLVTAAWPTVHAHKGARHKP